MKSIIVSENVYAVSEQIDTENFTVELSKSNSPICTIFYNHKTKKISVHIKRQALENSIILTNIANLCAVHKSFIKQQLTTTNLFGYVVSTIVK